MGVSVEYCQALLALNEHVSPEALLAAAIDAVMAETGAQRAYIELTDRGETALSWSQNRGEDIDVEGIKKRISSTMIKQALESGRVRQWLAAMEDPALLNAESVRLHEFTSVICAPLGRENNGVLFLERDDRFPELAYEAAGVFAIAVGLTVDRLLEQRRGRRFGVLTRSVVMQKLVDQIAHAATRDFTMLLCGPTGTGKTHLARAVHERSSRSGGPFIHVSCPSLPRELVVSELFGAEAGAHSGVARGRVAGRVELAEGGTLFLDEVGDLALPAQAQLLTFLDRMEYTPLGGRARTANVRVIAATNVNLARAVNDKTFREDLYQRLSELQYELPPLCDRTEDIPILARSFANNPGGGLPGRALEDDALTFLATLSFPGNVRELRTIVRRASLEADRRGGQRITTTDVQTAVGRETPTDATTFQSATRHYQRGVIAAALSASDWNVSAAARKLDVSRGHLHSLIRDFGLTRDG